MPASAKTPSKPSIGWSRSFRSRHSPATPSENWTASRRLNRHKGHSGHKGKTCRFFLRVLCILGVGSSEGSAPNLTPEAVRQNLVDQLRAEEVWRDVAGHGAQLDDVAAHDPSRVDHAAQQRPHLVPAQPTR